MHWPHTFSYTKIGGKIVKFFFEILGTMYMHRGVIPCKFTLDKQQGSNVEEFHSLTKYFLLLSVILSVQS